ncbi:HAD hydrolase-like protein [Candidatus Calescamantes bacterium]|nr:HAD hydrolase-like protein [Candidatus Calescamantes bacterium]
MKNDKKAVIFDLEVIVFCDISRAAKKLRQIKEKSSVIWGTGATTVTEEELKEYAFSLIHLANQGKLSEGDFYRNFEEHFRFGLTLDEFKEIWRDIFSLKKGMERTIYNLKKQFDLYLLANTNDIYFPYLIEKYPVLTLFDGFFLSYERGLLKPDKRIYQIILKESKLKPEQYLYITDSEECLQIAKSLGINGIRYCHDKPLMEALSIIGVRNRRV